jgi:sulfite reductase (NADPH) flavoprotein alpha-component
MFKNLVFQLHWLLGITAGLVLAVVGVTGAMLSFEDDLLKAINPGVMTVEARPSPLPPAQLLARVGAQWPDRTIQSLSLSSEPTDAARVLFAPAAGAAAPGGRARGEMRYVDPYTGALLAQPRRQGFFRLTMQIHRWLAADAIGKQIVGASTIALVFFCVSGLYLRWPRKWLDWRAWLMLDWAQKGRSFLWHLHSIVGTWVLAAYLVMSLTGLFWSYDWYRSGLYAITGTPVPAGRGGPPPQAGGAPARSAGGATSERGDRGGDAASPGPDAISAEPLDATALFAAFGAAVPARSVVTLRLPAAPGQPAEFSYQDPDPPHGRANNRLVLDAATGAVALHERFDDKPAGQRLMASIFPLHSGEYFGLAGLVLFMLASLLMPLFTVSGWMLYLDRRKKKAAVRAAAMRTAPTSAASANVEAANSADVVLVAHASQTGTAERLAWQTAASLQAGGLAARVVPLATLDAAALSAARRLLVVASTFGEGEPPDALRAFARRTLGRDLPLPELQFAVLALGDRGYDDFCAFGHAVARWLHRQGATPLFDTVEVDDGDAGALRHWQQQLSLLSGSRELPDWSAPAYRDAMLLEREHLNPGSPGGAVYRLALQPPEGEAWQAGDIAEIGPRHAEAEVARWLAASGHAASAPVAWQGRTTTLGAALAAAQLPVIAPLVGLPAQSVADVLVPLPHREYSIASLPGDGKLELLVRQMHRADGQPGLGSGWLTRHAPLGGPVALRVRANPGFRPPADDRPLVLVGNGTGLAGLHALLRARIAAGHRRNWLLFGERTAAHDFLFRDRLATAQAGGFLPHLDLAFSRDGGQRVYVQHRLREQAKRLRVWLEDGAAIYVCGSLEGMAPGVEAVLVEVLGADALEQLAADGRYRRDVY